MHENLAGIGVSPIWLTIRIFDIRDLIVSVHLVHDVLSVRVKNQPKVLPKIGDAEVTLIVKRT